MSKENARGMQDDVISRQAAIDALDEIEAEVADGYGYQYAKWREYFVELPFAQPDLQEYSVWFCIGETLVDVSKMHITAEEGIEKIRSYLRRMKKPVRCKDCQHYEYGICKKAGLCVNKSPNGFCDWGERKEVTT